RGYQDPGGEAGIARHQPGEPTRSVRPCSPPDSASVPARPPAQSIVILPGPPRDRRSPRRLEARRPAPAPRDQCQSRKNVGIASQGWERPLPAAACLPRPPTLCCRQGLRLGWQRSTLDRQESWPLGEVPCSAAEDDPPVCRLRKTDRVVART